MYIFYAVKSAFEMLKGVKQQNNKTTKLRHDSCVIFQSSCEIIAQIII